MKTMIAALVAVTALVGFAPVASAHPHHHPVCHYHHHHRICH
jgi:hypothetical protein